MKHSFTKYGHIAGGDIISLSADLSINNNFLIDSACGIEHRLNPIATESIRFLFKKPSYIEWLTYMTQNNLSKSNIYEILYFLNNIGGLTVKRSASSKLAMAKETSKYFIMGLSTQRISTRQKADFLGVSKATLNAAVPLYIASLIFILLIFASGITISSIWLLSATFIMLIILSLIAHELAHIYLLKRMNVKSIIIQRGLRLGVVHKKLDNSSDLKIALIGPLAGSLCCVIIALIFSELFGNKSFAMIGLLISIFHFMSWLPFYGDGKALLNICRSAN